MRLGEKQELFTRLWAGFQPYALAMCDARGYTLRMEEFFRHHSASHGHRRSTHRLKLAGHLLLFKDGKLLTDSADYLFLGTQWEAMHDLCRWGGRFNDGNHFSLEHGGVK